MDTVEDAACARFWVSRPPTEPVSVPLISSTIRRAGRRPERELNLRSARRARAISRHDELGQPFDEEMRQIGAAWARPPLRSIGSDVRREPVVRRHAEHAMKRADRRNRRLVPAQLEVQPPDPYRISRVVEQAAG